MIGGQVRGPEADHREVVFRVLALPLTLTCPAASVLLGLVVCCVTLDGAR